MVPSGAMKALLAAWVLLCIPGIVVADVHTRLARLREPSLVEEATSKPSLKLVAEAVPIEPVRPLRVPRGHNAFSFTAAAATPAPVPAATPAASSAPTTTAAAKAGGKDPDDASDWITNKNGTLKYGKILTMAICTVIVLMFCFIFRKYIITCIGWIETGCHAAFIAIRFPILMVIKFTQRVFYPIKQCILDTYERVNHYYHPYLVVS